MAKADNEGTAVDCSALNAGPCSFCPQPRVVLACKTDAGALVFFCRACVTAQGVRGDDGVVRDATGWPDLIGREAN